MSDLVLQTSFLGDVVLTTPLLTYLARATGPVDVITTTSAAPLLTGHPAVRRVLSFDKRRLERGAGSWRQVVLNARTASPDAVAYCAQGSLRTALLALLAGYRKRVGFSTSPGRLLYTSRIPYRAGQHHAERLLRLAVGDDAHIAVADLTPSLFPSATDRDAVDALLSKHGASTDPLIGLAPGSNYETKRWPGFAALASRLADAGRIVIIGSESDREWTAAIQSSLPDAIDATGRLTLLGSAELIRRCSVLVTNDSLPQHLASAVGTRAVTIFGPTVPGFGFGPLTPGSFTVGHETLPCRPCHPRSPAVCPLGHHRCMRDLVPEFVHARVRTVLASLTERGA